MPETTPTGDTTIPQYPRENLDCQIEGSILTIRVDLRCPGERAGKSRGVKSRNITVATSGGFSELAGGVKGSVTVCVPDQPTTAELRDIRAGIPVPA